jgi:hypothetical protein
LRPTPHEMARHAAAHAAEALQTNVARHTKAYERSLSHSDSYVVDDGKQGTTPCVYRVCLVQWCVAVTNRSMKGLRDAL